MNLNVNATLDVDVDDQVRFVNTPVARSGGTGHKHARGIVGLEIGLVNVNVNGGVEVRVHVNVNG